MAGYLNDRVLDNGLSALTSEANKLTICHTLPTTYTQANATYAVGAKTSPTVGSPTARSPSGRKVTISAITDGVISATSTGSSDDAQYWALVDTANSRLLAANDLAASQLVTSGNAFTLTAFDIGIPGPA